MVLETYVHLYVAASVVDCQLPVMLSYLQCKETLVTFQGRKDLVVKIYFRIE